jgi:uncharacterized protein YaeQ
MADKSTIYKVDLHVSDMDRHYFEQHSLTLAKHPSENENRLMIRLLAFALNADESLLFGKGVSTKEEPTLWIKDLTGAIKLWIDIGQPDAKAIKKACGRSDQVMVILYGRSSDSWWKNNSSDCSKRKNLKVVQIPEAAMQALTPMAERNMDMTCNIADGEVTIFSGEESFSFEPVTLYPAGKKDH